MLAHTSHPKRYFNVIDKVTQSEVETISDRRFIGQQHYLQYLTHRVPTIVYYTDKQTTSSDTCQSIPQLLENPNSVQWERWYCLQRVYNALPNFIRYLPNKITQKNSPSNKNGENF